MSKSIEFKNTGVVAEYANGSCVYECTICNSRFVCPVSLKGLFNWRTEHENCCNNEAKEKMVQQVSCPSCGYLKLEGHICTKCRSMGNEEFNAAERAIKLVHGSRKEAYGNPLIQARRVCLMWEAILGIPVTPKQFELCMLTMKVSREIGKEQPDNLDDIVGYTLVLEQVYKLLEEENRYSNK